MTQIFDVAGLGTSLTLGSGASRPWSRDVEELMVPGKAQRFRFYNYGLGGGSTADGAIYRQPVINLKPKVILIEYSMNDCKFDLPSAEANTRTLIAQLRVGTPASLLYLMVMNPVLGSALSLRPNIGAFYSLYRSLATELGLGLIDTASAWAGATLTDIPDGVHPTAEANKARLVPSIASTLRALIT